jgi:hypothetical protein
MRPLCCRGQKWSFRCQRKNAGGAPQEDDRPAPWLGWPSLQRSLKRTPTDDDNGGGLSVNRFRIRTESSGPERGPVGLWISWSLIITVHAKTAEMSNVAQSFRGAWD